MRPARLPSRRSTRTAGAGRPDVQIDPVTGSDVPLPALGARAHEGMRIDPQGNVSGSRKPPRRPRGAPRGYIVRFVPDRRGDLTSGQLYALKLVAPDPERTGEAIWIPLDREAVQVDADAAATAAGATGYARPEDVEMATSTGSARGGNQCSTWR